MKVAPRAAPGTPARSRQQSNMVSANGKAECASELLPHAAEDITKWADQHGMLTILASRCARAACAKPWLSLCQHLCARTGPIYADLIWPTCRKHGTRSREFHTKAAGGCQWTSWSMYWPNARGTNSSVHLHAPARCKRLPHPGNEPLQLYIQLHPLVSWGSRIAGACAVACGPWNVLQLDKHANCCARKSADLCTAHAEALLPAATLSTPQGGPAPHVTL